MVPDVSQKLRQAWRCRIEQKHESALNGYVELASIIGLPFGNGFEKNEVLSICSKTDPTEVIDTILLKASLRRMQGVFDESSELIKLSESLVSELGISGTYRLYFEKGLNFFATGDFTNALDCFLAAASKVKAKDDYSTWESLCAEMNSLMCFENLGIPSNDIINKINLNMKSLGSEVSEGISSQLEAYHLRNSFRVGEVSKLKLAKEVSLSANQVSSFKLWVARLPFHRYSLPQEKFSEKLAEFCVDQESNLFMRSFRLRTLQGIQHADDLSSFVKPSERIDRIYLWTWHWLQDPDTWPLNKIMSLLDPIRSSDFISHLTSEDKQLLVNALSWLDLFDRQKDHSAIIKKWSGGGNARFPIFDLEYLCIAYLKARRDRDDHLAADYYRQLANHPLWNSKDLYFKKIVEGSTGGRGAGGSANSLSGLCDNLARLIGVSSKSDAVITVDFATFKITNKKIGSTNSEPLCRALELLKKYKVVTKEHLLAGCFGLRSYDAILHDQKIYNLLQRINKMCHPHLQFKTKEGKIYSEGSWNGVDVLNHQVLSDQIGEHKQWQNLFNGPDEFNNQLGRDSEVKRKEISIPNEISTKDLQRILGKSRATTNRMISKWEEQRLVERRGKARATTLVLSEELIKKISRTYTKNNQFNGELHS